MASKRRVRQHGCTDKKRFATQEEAEQHVATIERYFGAVQTPYPCRWGQHWHVTAGFTAGLHANKARGKTRVYRGTY
jgi:hypothetical protein